MRPPLRKNIANNDPSSSVVRYFLLRAVNSSGMLCYPVVVTTETYSQASAKTADWMPDSLLSWRPEYAMSDTTDAKKLDRIKDKLWSSLTKCTITWLRLCESWIETKIAVDRVVYSRQKHLLRKAVDNIMGPQHSVVDVSLNRRCHMFQQQR